MTILPTFAGFLAAGARAQAGVPPAGPRRRTGRAPAKGAGSYPAAKGRSLFLPQRGEVSACELDAALILRYNNFHKKLRGWPRQGKAAAEEDSVRQAPACPEKRRSP